MSIADCKVNDVLVAIHFHIVGHTFHTRKDLLMSVDAFCISTPGVYTAAFRESCHNITTGRDMYDRIIQLHQCGYLVRLVGRAGGSVSDDLIGWH